jgi:hypothetical protein
MQPQESNNAQLNNTQLLAAIESLLEAKLEAVLETKLDAVLETKFDAKLQPLLTSQAQVFAELRAINQRIDGLEADFTKRIDGLEAKFEKRIDGLEADFTKRMDGFDNRLGRYTTKQGKLYEHLVLPNILQVFDNIGFHFDKLETNIVYSIEGSKDSLNEVDAVLENGKQVMLIETKGSLRNSFVNEHLARIKRLREAGFFTGKAIYGAIASAFAESKQIAYAQDAGLFVISKSESPVRINASRVGWTPQAW